MTKLNTIFDDVAGRCAAVRTLSASRSMTRHYDDALRPLGLTITQFTLLISIGYMQPESITEIATALNIDRTSLTRNLKPLEAAGYVTRGHEGSQRRRRIELTAAGKQIVSKAYPLWQAAQRQVEAAFGPGDFKDAMATLATLVGVAR